MLQPALDVVLVPDVHADADRAQFRGLRSRPAGVPPGDRDGGAGVDERGRHGGAQPAGAAGDEDADAVGAEVGHGPDANRAPGAVTDWAGGQPDRRSSRWIIDRLGYRLSWTFSISTSA